MLNKEIEEQVKEALENNSLSEEDQQELRSLLLKLDEYRKYNMIEEFKPLSYQQEFFAKGKDHRYRFLCAANRLGKSHGCCYEMALHLTGKYPKDWAGYKFTKPINAWVVGMDRQLVANSLQEKLIGTNSVKQGKEDKIGTGFIPRDCIRFETIQRDGMICVSLSVKHYTDGIYDGDSELTFKSYAQGVSNLQAVTLDAVMLDEESEFNSMGFYTELLTRVRTTKGILLIAATPVNGRTELVSKFMDNPADQEFFMMAGVPDAIPELYSEKDFAEMKQEYPTWQHGYRLYGDPSTASGLLYEWDLDSITIPPFQIPDHWRQIAGIDLGWNHPTACIWACYDSDRDTIYITDEYGASETLPSVHASAIKKKGDWIPLVMPHDALHRHKNTGEKMIEIYKKEGVNALQETFYNHYSSTGAHNIDPMIGIDEILTRMKTGRFKIFSPCQKLIGELRNYRMKNNKIVDLNDDYADAMRYAAMSVVKRGVSKSSIDNPVNFETGFRWN